MNSNFFPNLYISEVELDDNSSADFRGLTYQNPHIKNFAVDNQNESDISKTVTAKVQFGFTISEQNSEKYGKFFDKSFYKKYLKFKFIQASSVAELNLVRSYINNSNIDGLESLQYSTSLEIRNLSFDEFNSYIDKNGNKEKEVYYTSKIFTIKNENLNHLSYMVFSYIDTDLIEQEYDLNFSNIKTEISEVCMESVYNQGKPVFISNIFIDSNGSLYNGIVEYDESDDRYFKGSSNEILRKIEVPNKVVKDNRSIANITKIGNDFSEINKRLTIGYKNPSDFNAPVFEIPRQYFSDCFITSDMDGKARAAFAINHKNLIKFNCAFPWMLEERDNDDIQDILNRSYIKYMKIYRQRMLKVGDNDYIEDKNTPRELISLSFENSYKNITSKDIEIILSNNGEDKYVVSSIREMLQNQDGLRMFTFVDNYMEFINTGYYDYIVEISCYDGTISALNDIYTQLDSASTDLRKYIELVLNSNGYDTFNDKLSVDAVEYVIASSKSSRQIPLWDYLPTQILLLSNLIKPIELNGENLPPEITLEITLKNLLEPNSGSFSLSGVRKVQKIIDDMLFFVKSQLASVGGVNSSKSGKTWPPKTSVGRVKNLETNDITIVKNIGGKFNSELNTSRGIDFLTSTDDDGVIVPFVDSNGLNTINGVDYIKRTDDETSNFFEQGADITIQTNRTNFNPNDNISKNALSFLTPSFIKGANKIVNLSGARSLNQEIVEDAVLALELSSKNIKPTNSTNTKKPLNYLNNNEVKTKNIMSSLEGFDFQPQQTKIEDKTETKITENKNLDREGERTSQLPPLKITRFFSNMQKETVKNLNKRREMASLKTLDSFDVKKTNNAINNKIVSKNKLIEMPNQLKSLFSHTSGNPSVLPNSIVGEENKLNNLDYTNIDVFRFNYELIGKVEFLERYELSDKQDIMTKFPVWKTLTKNEYDSLVGSEVLCRTVDYKHYLGTKSNSQSENPIYNQYFILKPVATQGQEQEEPQISVPTTTDPNTLLQDLRSSSIPTSFGSRDEDAFRLLPSIEKEIGFSTKEIDNLLSQKGVLSQFDKQPVFENVSVVSNSFNSADFKAAAPVLTGRVPDTLKMNPDSKSTNSGVVLRTRRKSPVRKFINPSTKGVLQ